MAYHETTHIHEIEDAHGNVVTEKTTVTAEVKKREEPNYIKIYTDMWCMFKGVPEKWRMLFLALATRMTYVECSDPNDDGDGGQLVYVIGKTAEKIMAECGWKTKDPLYKGLKALTEYNAIRKISRGEYQINPEYASRGQWNYNSKEKQGGIKNLIAKFNFADESVETEVIWNDSMRDLDNAETSMSLTSADDDKDS